MISQLGTIVGRLEYMGHKVSGFSKGWRTGERAGRASGT